jgi:fatty acid desaturase
MFDFFRDMVNEARGLDTDKMKLEKQQIQERKKESYYIFSKSMRNWFIGLAALYVCVAAFSISAFYSSGAMSVSLLLQFVVKAILAIVVIVALFTRKKDGEIVALVATFLFICTILLSTILL